MLKEYKIGIIPGDGIGRDAVRAAQIVLDTINDLAPGFRLEFKQMMTGDAAVEKTEEVVDTTEEKVEEMTDTKEEKQ